MNPNLTTKTFNYTEFRSAVVAGLIKSGTLSQGTNGWHFTFPQEVTGISSGTYYPTLDDAGDAIVPVLFNNAGTILQAAA